MSCKECCCHKDFVSCETSIINVKAKLDPSSLYYYTLKTTRGRSFTKDFMTDGNGDWSIVRDDLPADFLVQGTKFKVSVTRKPFEKTTVPMTMLTQIPCMHVEVSCTSGDIEKDFIGEFFILSPDGDLYEDEYDDPYR